jgi:hypothetical protein
MPDRETLGLTDPEIAWLRANAKADPARNLIRVYNMVVACPSDPGARGIFDAMLGNWRRSREYPDAPTP